jgi:hypothetical protein
MNAEAFKQLSQEYSDEAIAATDKKHCTAFDYIDGQRDCREVGKSKPGKSAEYYRGYGDQYAMEEVKTELSGWK